MALPPIVEGDLNPLRPRNYGSDMAYWSLVEGLLETGPVVRTEEDVNSEFPVVPESPFEYSDLGTAAVFAVSAGAVDEVLRNRDTYSSYAGGTGILPFRQTSPAAKFRVL